MLSNVLIADVSFYEDDPATSRHIDFVKMKSAGVEGVIVRAGQNTWIDASFVQSWKDAKAAGLPRGSYWFLDSRSSMQSQAKIYAGLLEDDAGELPVFVDFEKNPNAAMVTAMQLKEFIAAVQNLLPNKEVMIYTGYWDWKDNVPLSMFDYFKQFGLWIAAYNSSGPTLPAPFTKWDFWQFTDAGEASKYGTEGAVDLSYFNGDLSAFNARFKLNQVIKHTYTRRFDSDVHTVIVPKGSDVRMYASGVRQTVLTMAQKTGAKVAVNGGDYDPYTGDPTGILAVNGLVRSGFEGFMPWLNVTKSNEVQINEYNAGVTPYNAVAGRRMLVVDGKQSDKTSPAWLEVHPKTFFGVTANGELIIITADGRTEKSRGVNLYEGALLLIEAGAVRGFDGGGGGDTTLVIDGQVTNVPIADRTAGELRPVADGVLVFGTIEQTTGESMKYIVKKSARFRSAPTMDTNDTGASSVVGDVFESTVTQIDAHDNVTRMVQYPTGKWLPLVYMGTEFTALQSVTPPPPATDSFPSRYKLTNEDPSHPDFGKSAEYVKV